jgi:PAS domain S-box-containing protein
VAADAGAPDSPDDTASLWRAARDALLDLTDRRDAVRALTRLLAELEGWLGAACRVRGPVEAAAATTRLSLPLQRLGRLLGHLDLDALVPVGRLEPVLPALATLLAQHGAVATELAAGRQGGPEAELIRSALRGTDTLVWEWWIETDMLDDFDEGLQLLGYEASAGGYPHALWNELIHPDDRAANHEAYLRHERGETEVYEHVYRIRAADGSWRWMLERGRLVERGEDGRPLRMVGTQTDITARRELERAREEAAQAQAASRAKTEFLARMSHELRTPLNAVLGFTQLMQIDRTEPPGPEQRRRLQLIREAGEHLLHMINDLLDLTRIESGGLALAPSRIELRELVLQVFALLSEAAARQGVSLELLPGPLLAVDADRTRLKQVLINLVSNAIKYNKPGGRVDLTVEPAGDGLFLIAVADTGVGIAEEHLQRLFEPFQRGPHERSGIEGSGIGLALTQALVLRMGGTLGVQSRPGEGSVFSVRLPVVPD